MCKEIEARFATKLKHTNELAPGLFLGDDPTCFSTSYSIYLCGYKAHNIIQKCLDLYPSQPIVLFRFHGFQGCK